MQHPPYFEGMPPELGKTENVVDAGVLAMLGDSITTEHISLAGAGKAESPEGCFCRIGMWGARAKSYSARHGPHEVMMRGTFANIRIRTEMLEDVEGASHARTTASFF